MKRALVRKCRPIYRFGMLLVMVGIALCGAGLVARLLGKGWMTGLIGIGCAVSGIIVGQVAELALTSEMKFLVESVTPKQAHDFAVSHLQAYGEDVEDTDVFLGKFIAEMDQQGKQRTSRTKSCK